MAEVEVRMNMEKMVISSLIVLQIESGKQSVRVVSNQSKVQF